MKDSETLGSRKFYHLQHPESVSRVQVEKKEKKNELAKYINDNIIGRETTFLSPFGRRSMLYCDYTASGKSLSFIEDYITQEVLPLYGNTHTTTSVTSLQTTLFRHEARDIIRNCVNAGEGDAVIFAGSGCTGAVHKLVNALGDISDSVVFVGHHEHHSNLLPWKEAGAHTVTIGSSEDGSISLQHLEEELARYQGRNLIGCFNVCSNVTGVLEDDLAITALLHQYGALSFWDYASAAPYVNIDVNPKVAGDVHGLAYKDALYFSMHKFVGGVQTPGVLVAKKHLFRSRVPNGAGGGTVFFVTEEHHRYLQDVESREEGGTPYIVESVRAGLTMKLKHSLGPSYIMEKERCMRSRALERWSHLENLEILGPGSSHQIPIFSFLIRHPETGLFLHYNYVVALLNDLFGIQSRGGCACAGPYMQSLLGLDPQLALQYEQLLLEDSRLDRVGLRRGHAEHSEWEILRPGSTRINLSWFWTEEELDYVVEALELVAQHGWKLLPLYRFNNETGDWYHVTNTKFKDRRWLGHVTFENGRLEQLQNHGHESVDPTPSLTEALALAKDLFASATFKAQREVVPDQSKIFPPEVDKLRWFVIPSEAKTALITPSEGLQVRTPPFTPKQFQVSDDSAVPGSLSGEFHTSRLDPILAQSKSEFVPWTINLPAKKTKTESKKSHKSKTDRSSSLISALDTKLSVSDNHLPTDGQAKPEENGRPEPEAAPPNQTEAAPPNQTEAAPPNLTAAAPPNLTEAAPPNLTEAAPPNLTPCNDGTCVLPGGKRETAIPELKPQTAKWKPPTKDIFKPFLEAVTEFDMIRDGDKVLVGLSGGKDSLSLLHTIRQYQFYASKSGIKFKLGAVTVDPMSSAYDPRPLIPYLQQLGVEYLYEEQDIMKQAMEVDASSICAFCSRMKRGRIYAAARRSGYNVIALGQHLDDICESFFMSVFHNGRLRTMKAHYTNAEGDIRIIRPLVYVRENTLRHFAESQKLPIIAENCPACFEIPKERQRIKQLLATQELLFPRLYWNLKSALYPVMRINRTGLESALFGKAAGDVIKQLTGDDVIKHMNGDDVSKQSNGNVEACAEDEEDF